MTLDQLRRRLALLERTGTAPRRVFRVVCPAGGPVPKIASNLAGETVQIADIQDDENVLLICRRIIDPPHTKMIGGPDD